YILQAVRAQMNGTTAPAPSVDSRVHLSIEPSVLEPFRREGETLTQTAERLLTAGLAAAQRAEK
ncbi:MAG: hypothetical protein IJ484_03195, partial [Oscillospiraceae bacterium]|nr:hypothetical protein [Oscillospiraceae bacterium]